MFDDRKFHIIPSVREMRKLDQALKYTDQWVLLTCAHIGNLQKLSQYCHQAGKKVIINPELVGGLGNDRMAFALMKKMFGVDGVMSGSNTKLLMAKKEGMYTIRRVALEDSLAVDQVLSTMKETKSDVIELRPAYYALRYLNVFKEKRNCPYIAGGFVDSTEMLEQLNRAGFTGVTTSDSDLWKLRAHF
jgi:glycerol uptake operon antiterminator